MSSHAIDQRPASAVASTRHTVVFLLALLILAIQGIRNPIQGLPATLARPHARIFLYLQVLAVQGLMVGYVVFGMRRSATSLRALIDDSRWTALRWLRYVGIGVAGWIVYLAIGAGLSAMLRPGPEALRGLQAMLPQTSIERTLWAAFAISVGICEEIVYRGYFLRQFRALTRSTLAAVLLQALCYSVVHLALPVQMLPGIAVLGLLLGGLAVWQKSLVPGMVLHVFVGLVALVQPSGSH